MFGTEKGVHLGGPRSALAGLVQRGILSTEMAAGLTARVLQGEHTIFVGCHRSARSLLAESLVHDLEQVIRVWSAPKTNGLSVASQESHNKQKTTPLQAAAQAYDMGFDFVFFHEIRPLDLADILISEPRVVLIASVLAVSSSALGMHLNERLGISGIKAERFLESVFSVGFGEEGDARVYSTEQSSQKNILAGQLLRPAHIPPLGWEREASIIDPGWELDGRDIGEAS